MILGFLALLGVLVFFVFLAIHNRTVAKQEAHRRELVYSHGGYHNLALATQKAALEVINNDMQNDSFRYRR